MSSFTNKNGNAQPKLDGPNDLTAKWKTSYIVKKEAAEAAAKESTESEE